MPRRQRYDYWSRQRWDPPMLVVFRSSINSEAHDVRSLAALDIRETTVNCYEVRIRLSMPGKPCNQRRHCLAKSRILAIQRLHQEHELKATQSPFPGKTFGNIDRNIITMFGNQRNIALVREVSLSVRENWKTTRFPRRHLGFLSHMRNHNFDFGFRT